MTTSGWAALGLDRNTGGVRMLQPTSPGRCGVYRGTADAVLQNLNVIEQPLGRDPRPRGDHIYKMDTSRSWRRTAPPGGRDDRGPAVCPSRREPDGDPGDERDQPHRRVSRKNAPAQERSGQHGVYVFTKRASASG